MWKTKPTALLETLWCCTAFTLQCCMPCLHLVSSKYSRYSVTDQTIVLMAQEERRSTSPRHCDISLDRCGGPTDPHSCFDSDAVSMARNVWISSFLNWSASNHICRQVRWYWTIPQNLGLAGFFVRVIKTYTSVALCPKLHELCLSLLKFYRLDFFHPRRKAKPACLKSFLQNQWDS